MSCRIRHIYAILCSLVRRNYVSCNEIPSIIKIKSTTSLGPVAEHLTVKCTGCALTIYLERLNRSIRRRTEHEVAILTWLAVCIV